MSAVEDMRTDLTNAQVAHSAARRRIEVLEAENERLREAHAARLHEIGELEGKLRAGVERAVSALEFLHGRFTGEGDNALADVCSDALDRAREALGDRGEDVR